MQSLLAASLFLIALFFAATAFAGENVLVDVDWLVNYYAKPVPPEEDEYFGKTIEVQGWVTALDSCQYIELRRFSARTTHTRCYLSGRDSALPKRTDSVRIRGVCRGYDKDIDAVVLVDCEVIDFSPHDSE